VGNARRAPHTRKSSFRQRVSELFRTFTCEDPGIPIVYGLVYPIGSLNPIVILSHEWRAIIRDAASACSGRDLLRQLFGPPGPPLGRRSIGRQRSGRQRGL